MSPSRRARSRQPVRRYVVGSSIVHARLQQCHVRLQQRHARFQQRRLRFKRWPRPIPLVVPHDSVAELRHSLSRWKFRRRHQSGRRRHRHRRRCDPFHQLLPLQRPYHCPSGLVILYPDVRPWSQTSRRSMILVRNMCTPTWKNLCSSCLLYTSDAADE